MAFTQLAGGEHLQHLVRELEQPQPVRDRWLRAADPVGDLAEREPELVQQNGVSARFLQRRQLFPGDVLDQAEDETLAVVGLPHHGRYRGEPGSAGSTQSPLAGDQLVATLLTQAHDQRLQ